MPPAFKRIIGEFHRDHVNGDGDNRGQHRRKLRRHHQVGDIDGQSARAGGVAIFKLESENGRGRVELRGNRHP